MQATQTMNAPTRVDLDAIGQLGALMFQIVALERLAQLPAGAELEIVHNIHIVPSEPKVDAAVGLYGEADTAGGETDGDLSVPGAIDDVCEGLTQTVAEIHASLNPADRAIFTQCVRGMRKYVDW